MSTFRPDLSEYRIYIELLADKLNENALFKMSNTDVIKILIEQKMAELVPDVVINRKRKIYQTLEF